MLILSAFQENKAIRDNVMVNVYYKPFFYKQNTLYELEIIKDLAKYSGYSPLIEHILLYYRHAF